MKECEGIRELIPWYVEGTLSPEESSAVAEHLGTCSDCLHDVAVAIRVRLAVRDALASEPPASEEMWERVSRQAVGRRLAQLDVGSFLVGLRLGAWLTRRGTPVRADLRLLGREVRLVHRNERGGSS
jgi:anti-sigma factor RsiW